MSERHQFGESEEMYLKTVYVLAEAQDPVPVTALAEKLKITTVSASEMVHRLQQRRLLEHTPYKGVRLTPLGEKKARSVLRRHRLWERFLIDRLELDWAHAHDAACQLEHVVGVEIIDALDRFLEWPQTCPHGNPIPRTGDLTPESNGQPLSELGVGEEADVLSVHSEEAALLAYLDTHELRPGQHLRIEEIGPYDGPRTLRIDQETRVVGRDVARRVLVRKSGPTHD